VLSGQASSIHLEGPNAEAGFEFSLVTPAGTEYHQVKRQKTAEGRWTLAALDEAKVLSAFYEKLQDPNAICVFASGHSAHVLEELSIDGAELMGEADYLAGGDINSWAALASAAGVLRQMKVVIWRPATSAEGAESDVIEEKRLRQAREIRVEPAGHALCAARQRGGGDVQINIFHGSTVGQVGMGDVHAGDISMLLAQAERELDQMAVPEEAKKDARDALRQMRGIAATVATSTAGSLLTAALRRAMGME
jgi:hypothetical protein